MGTYLIATGSNIVRAATKAYPVERLGEYADGSPWYGIELGKIHGPAFGKDDERICGEAKTSDDVRFLLASHMEKYADLTYCPEGMEGFFAEADTALREICFFLARTTGITLCWS